MNNIRSAAEEIVLTGWFTAKEPLPTVEEQQNTIAEAGRKKPRFCYSQEDVDAVLIRGSGLQDGKFRIYEQYLKRESAAENAAMLKTTNTAGAAHTPAVIGSKLDGSPDGKGIKISRGSISNQTPLCSFHGKRSKRIES